MSPLPCAVGWQSTHALAHELYIECSRDREYFRPLTKAIKLLRNELEEVDEIFGEGPIRPENFRLLFVVDDSKNVLLRLRAALHHFRQNGEEWVTSKVTIDSLNAGLAVVTKNLSNALNVSTSGVLTSDTTTPEELLTGTSEPFRSAQPPRLRWSNVPFQSPDPLSMDIETATTMISQDRDVISPGNLGTPLRHTGASTPISPASVNGPALVGEENQTSGDTQRAGAVLVVKLPFEQNEHPVIIAEKGGSTRSNQQFKLPTHGVSSDTPTESETELVSGKRKDDVLGKIGVATKSDDKSDCVANLNQVAIESERGANDMQGSDETTMSHKPESTPPSVRAIIRTIESETKPGHGRDHSIYLNDETKAEWEILQGVNTHNNSSGPPQPAVIPTIPRFEGEIHAAGMLVETRVSSSVPVERQAKSHPPPRIDSVVSTCEGNMVETNKGGMPPDFVAIPSPPGRAPHHPRRPAPSVPNLAVPPIAPAKPVHFRSSSQGITRSCPSPRARILNLDRVERNNQSSEDLYTSSRPSFSHVPDEPLRARSCEVFRRPQVPDVVINPPTRNPTIMEGNPQSPLLENPLAPPDCPETADPDSEGKQVVTPPPSTRGDDGKIVVSPPVPPRPPRRGSNMDSVGIEVDEPRRERDNKEVVRLRDLSQEQLTLVNGIASNADFRRVDQEGHLSGDLDRETEARMDIARVDHILQYWNEGQRWVEAELYLWAHLKRQVELGKLESARRIRHLIGVAASMQGQWHKALLLFISVLNKPIRSSSHLDAGDCASVYWMGDTYTMLNRRAEAVLAYTLAERGPLFQDRMRPRLQRHIRAEQAVCLMGLPKAEYMNHLATVMQNRDILAEDSILDPKYCSLEAAIFFLHSESWLPLNENYSEYPKPRKSRSQAFFLASDIWHDQHRLQLKHDTLDDRSPWPMAYDPYFTVADVSCGRYFAIECDLRHVFLPGTTTRLAHNGPIWFSRWECFTCDSLPWLIDTLREFLTVFEYEWSEVSNDAGAWFVVRYLFFEDKIATINYFSIALFRTSLAGYGADICSGGLYSARNRRFDLATGSSDHFDEAKSLKKRIREYLSAAHKRTRRSRLSINFPSKRASSSTFLPSTNVPVYQHGKDSASRNTSGDSGENIVYR